MNLQAYVDSVNDIYQHWPLKFWLWRVDMKLCRKWKWAWLPGQRFVSLWSAPPLRQKMWGDEKNCLPATFYACMFYHGFYHGFYHPIDCLKMPLSCDRYSVDPDRPLAFSLARRGSAEEVEDGRYLHVPKWITDFSGLPGCEDSSWSWPEGKVRMRNMLYFWMFRYRVLSPKRQTKTLLSQTVKWEDLLFQSYCDLVHLVPGTHRFSQAVPWTSFGKC